MDVARRRDAETADRRAGSREARSRQARVGDTSWWTLPRTPPITHGPSLTSREAITQQRVRPGHLYLSISESMVSEIIISYTPVSGAAVSLGPSANQPAQSGRFITRAETGLKLDKRSSRTHRGVNLGPPNQPPFVAANQPPSAGANQPRTEQPRRNQPPFVASLGREDDVRQL